jgi:hypothetical protein
MLNVLLFGSVHRGVEVNEKIGSRKPDTAFLLINSLRQIVKVETYGIKLTENSKFNNLDLSLILHCPQLSKRT